MISIRRSYTFAAAALAAMLMGGAVFAQDAPTKPEGDKPVRKRMLERRPGADGFRAGKRQRMGRHGMRGMRGGPIAGFRALELTEDQKTQLKTLMQGHRESNKPIHEELKTLMSKRREGTLTEADKARAAELREQMKASGEQLRTSALGLLTPDQTQKLEEMKAQRQQRMEERRERMHQRRQKMKERRQQMKDAPKVVDQ